MGRRKYVSGTKWCFWRWTDVDSEYITRLHFFKCPWFAICFHWLNKPDPEPYDHDHPVTFLSVILRGWYREQQSGYWRQPRTVKHRWFNWIDASEGVAHTIVEVAPRTLTVCFMGPKTREWGFHTPNGWMYWKDYYALKRAGKQP